MEGQHHKKRAVRITRKGVQPSPHVLHLGRDLPFLDFADEEVVAPPRSLAVEVALEHFRIQMHDRFCHGLHHAYDHIRSLARRLRPALRVRVATKQISVAHALEHVLKDSVPVVAHIAEEAVQKERSLRERIAGWMAGRVIMSTVHMPPRRLSIAFFVALLALMVIPFGVIKIYHGARIQKAQFQEQKVLMVSLSSSVRDSLSRGDFDEAQRTLKLLEEALQLIQKTVDATGPLRYVPPFYQARQGIEAARETLTQGSVVLRGMQQFPWSPQLFTAAHASLDAADRAARNLGHAHLGFDADLVHGYVRLFKDSLAVAQTFIGNEDGRYLVVFQNENELRPTGGFMGSFAVLTLHGGAWSIEMPSQGSYALQGWLTKSVRAPKPLALVNSRFEFQDVNWFPDFPTTAQKIMSFYEEGGGSSVDGVIAVNSSFLNDVLALAGPVEVKEVSQTALKSGTVVEALEKAIARDRATAAPKAVLGGLLDALATRFQSGAVHPVAAAKSTLTALSEKKIQLYFRSADTQAAVSRLGFDGAIPLQWNNDFVMVNSANVAGGKTDGAIRDAVDYNVSVQENGNMIAHVTLTRTHEGLRGDALRGVRNVSFVRFYAPRGSEFLGATGFSPMPSWRFESPAATLVPDEDVRTVELTEKQDQKSGTIIAEESRKAVFGNWLMIDPGEVKTVQLRYRLPQRMVRGMNNSYALMVAKQSGRTAGFHFTMNAPGFSIIAQPTGDVSREGFSTKATLATDMITRLELNP